MSITILQSPKTYSPVFNPMNFVCSSNNIAGNNYFFYLCKIKDSSGNVISQHRFTPRYDNDYLLFDVSRELEKYTSYDISGISVPSYGVRRTSNVFKEYTVQFIEEIGSVASVVASGLNTISSTLYAYNGSFEYTQNVSYLDTDWLIDTGTKKFLTDLRGGNIRIKEGQSYELGIMTGAGAGQPVKNIVIKTYDNSGTIIGTYKIANSYSSGTTTADKFLSVLVGTADLNLTTLGSGSQPVITSSVSTYTVYIENNSSTIVSETLTFEIDRTCYQQDEIRLHWLNSLGRIDSYNFNFANDVSYSVERQAFKKDVGAFNGSAYGYKTYEPATTNYYTKVDKKIKIRTDYINNIEAEWFKNLVSSPIVWAEVDGVLVNVIMDTSSYNVQTIEKNKLFSVEFDLTYSNSSFRQRL